MEVVGVTTGVMKPLLSKLTKLLGEEYAKFKGARKQIMFLRDELSAMSATLEMLEDAEQLDPGMRLWRDKLRELAFDLEDCIDGFMATADHGRDGMGFKKYFRKLKRLKARHEIGNQIEELKACVVEASERYKFVEMSSKSSAYCAVDPPRSYCAVDPRLSTLYVEIDQLVGIDGPMKHIIELLTMENKASSAQLKVLSIVSCGGIGKTTIANQVYKNVKGQFSCGAFVSVSQNPDVKKLLRDIAKEVGVTDNILDANEKRLIDKLREHLQDKSFEDSKRLLLKRAFGSESLSCTHLGSVPDEILRKCDGLPLAIITISSILTDKHEKCEWDRVLNNIGSTLAKNPGAEKMIAILSMSYYDIPHRLRTCLLYLSLFPEDYQIEKQRLINRWIAEGFVHKEEGRTKYEIGEGYFNDLINRSMIQPVHVKYGQAMACQVHDIILDYIKCKAAEENFVTSLDAAENVHTSEYKVRRLCVINQLRKNVAIWEDPILSHVRSVTTFGQPVKTSLLASPALRVLDLGHCWGMEGHHLASIGNLFHLKYLRLCSHLITKLPDKIGELQYLQTLDVQGTRIEVLPYTITKLKRLAHLYVDDGVRFPRGMIGRMHSLEELREYGVQSYKQVKSLVRVSKLAKLRTLKVKWHFDFGPLIFSEIHFRFDVLDVSERLRQVKCCQSYVGTLLSSCNLYNLHLELPSRYPLSLDSWHPAAPYSLRKLSIQKCYIYKVPNWMGSLGNLVELKLNIFCLRPKDLEILGTMPSLLFLELVTLGGMKGRIIVHGSSGFKSLKYFSLCIYSCGTALEFQVGSMPNLEYLNLRFCVHMRECLNGASSLGVEHLYALSKVEVQICGSCEDNNNYDPTKDKYDEAIRWVASAIYDAIVTVPNRPTVRFITHCDFPCIHFECKLRSYNQSTGWVLTEWLKSLQIGVQQEGTKGCTLG
ncbi:unnamed protein product [Urochloa decumbens]|uniref:Uncharacterized protein n=1 Tax=Urochloa decumbens TaxID=240449 RepID=A0ABC9BTX0_9POAL